MFGVATTAAMLSWVHALAQRLRAVRAARRTRFSVTLEIDAAALFFPIAESRGLGARRAADLPRSWRCVQVVDRVVGGKCRFRVSGRWNGVRDRSVLFGSVRHSRIVPEFGLWDHRKPVEKQGVSP
jgi:hypothetical protein